MYFKNINSQTYTIVKQIKFQVYQVGEDRAACCGITTGRSQKSNQI